MRKIRKFALYLLLVSLIGFPAFLNTEKVLFEEVSEEQTSRIEKS